MKDFEFERWAFGVMGMGFISDEIENGREMKSRIREE